VAGEVVLCTEVEFGVDSKNLMALGIMEKDCPSMAAASCLDRSR